MRVNKVGAFLVCSDQPKFSLLFFWLLRYKQVCQATSKRKEQDACTARGHTGSSTCHQQGSDARAPQQGWPPALLYQQVCLPGGLSTPTLLQWPVGRLTLCPATVGTAVKQYSESVHCANPLCSHAKGCPFLVCPLCLPLCSNATGSPLLASPMCLRTMLAGNRNCNTSISKPCAATIFLLVIVCQQQLLIAKGFSHILLCQGFTRDSTKPGNITIPHCAWPQVCSWECCCCC